VWTSSADWGKTLSGQVLFAKKRLSRFGVLKTVDEILYYLLAKNVLKPAGRLCQERLWNAYVREYGWSEWKGSSIRTGDVNSNEALRFVRESSPDLIMSMCINEFFRMEIRQIPRLGAFLWHEGIVPEYKGLYSPFWAIHNREPEMLGYTVLRMNDRYDEGEVFLQGKVTGVDFQVDSPVYIGHKAILDSLPEVARMFWELENGIALPISTEGRESGRYTYPGLSDWIRFRIGLRSVSEKVSVKDTDALSTGTSQGAIEIKGSVSVETRPQKNLF
jgi:hypothetical protein